MPKPLFQFTRPRGARPRPQSPAARANRFNSRAHGGRDWCWCPCRTWHSRFQFTRPRGARLAPTAFDRPLVAFQFTRPRGARRNAVAVTSPHGVSIHAPTGGATRSGRPVRVDMPRFNSRAHGGRDRYLPSASACRDVSIHAPTGGATDTVDRVIRYIGFNSRAHGGRD